MEIIQSFNNFIETSYNIVENANKIIFNKLHKNKEILNYTNHSTTLIIYIHGKDGSQQESQLLYNHLPKNINNELKYDNELLQNLIYLSKNNHLKIYNIVLIKDFVVLPITSQYLTYAKDVYFINDNVSHYGIMYYDNTIKQILLWLNL